LAVDRLYCRPGCHSYSTDFTPIVGTDAILLSTGFSAAIGLFFGYIRQAVPQTLSRWKPCATNRSSDAYKKTGNYHYYHILFCVHAAGLCRDEIETTPAVAETEIRDIDRQRTMLRLNQCDLSGDCCYIDTLSENHPNKYRRARSQITAINGNLFIRRGPDLAFNPVGVLYEGNSAIVIAQDVLSDWCRSKSPVLLELVGFLFRPNIPK